MIEVGLRTEAFHCLSQADHLSHAQSQRFNLVWNLEVIKCANGKSVMPAVRGGGLRTNKDKRHTFIGLDQHSRQLICRKTFGVKTRKHDLRARTTQRHEGGGTRSNADDLESCSFECLLICDGRLLSNDQDAPSVARFCTVGLGLPGYWFHFGVMVPLSL